MGKPWPHTLGSHLGLVGRVPGGNGGAWAPPGAVRELCRVLSELKISPRSPRRSLSVACSTPKRVVPTTSCSRKDGRMHGSKRTDAHTMAEMTESHEDSSILSTHALDTRFFLRGRRMWPHEIRRPRRGVWGGLKRYLGSNTLIRYCIGALGG